MQQALHYLGPSNLGWRPLPDAELAAPTDAVVRPSVVAGCDLDRLIAAGTAPFPPPFVLGHEFTGTVTALGDAVRTLGIGDTVIASFQPSCGACTACHRGRTSACTSAAGTAMYGIGAAGGDWSGALADSIRVPWADANLRRLPDGVSAIAAAPASDNVADGLRAVDVPLAEEPGASVLIAASGGSIALYAVLCAMHLGAGRVSFASRERVSLEIAERLGARCLPVDDWPRRFETHDLTVDCTGDSEALAAVVRTTAAYGHCTSTSIFFGEQPMMPMFDMNMKGIHFHTGRVNSAAMLDRVLELIGHGLDPLKLEPNVVGWDEAADALIDGSFSRKVIVERATNQSSMASSR